MTPERWKRVKRILDEVWERGAENRAAFLGEVCGGDDELRAEVEALLACDQDAGELFEERVDAARVAAACEIVDAGFDVPAGGETTGTEAGLIGKRIGP